jgi:hypothetical protein
MSLTLGKMKHLSSKIAIVENQTENLAQEYRIHVLEKRSRQYILIDSGTSISVMKLRSSIIRWN